MARKKQKIEKGTIQLVLGLGALWLFLKIADTNPGAITLVRNVSTILRQPAL